MTTDVTIVVATRNRRNQLLDLLPRHTAPVIVVDNGSDDGTPAAVTAAFPEVRVVALGRNAGAGAARNVGLPTPSGRDPGARRRVEARNRLLTAALRRPAGVVRAVAAQAWRDPDGRAGLRDAVRHAGWVLRHRRRLPADVEAALTALSRVEPAPTPPVPAPVGVSG